MPEIKAIPKQFNFPRCPDECVHFAGGGGALPCTECVRNLGVTGDLYDFMRIKEGGTNEFESEGGKG